MTLFRRSRIEALNEYVERKAQSYTNVDDLIHDLEHGEFIGMSESLLDPYEWNGSTVAFPDDPYTKYRLLLAAVKRHAFQAAQFLVLDFQVRHADLTAALFILCWKDQNDAPQNERMELAHVLLQAGANPNTLDAKGRPLLHVCLDNQAPMALVSTVAAFADVNVKNKKGNTVLHEAIARDNVPFVRLLLSLTTPMADTTSKEMGGTVDPHVVDRQGRLPLVLAAHLSQDACLRLLLRRGGANVNYCDAHGRTALHMIENPAAALVLLQKGARSDLADEHGVTPLHTAFGLWMRWRRGHSLSKLLFFHKRVALADLLVAQASNVNIRDHHGRTPLHYAAEEKHSPALEYVQYLVATKGARVNVRDANGWTPLHVAVAFGNYDTAGALMALGADITLRDVQGRTAMHLMGMDKLALAKYPRHHESDAIRIAAFGRRRAPAPRFVAPLSDASRREQQQQEETNNSSMSSANSNLVDTTESGSETVELPLVEMFLCRDFDFMALDRSGNLPFFLTQDDTLRYQMIHAAASQGLFK